VYDEFMSIVMAPGMDIDLVISRNKDKIEAAHVEMRARAARAAAASADKTAAEASYWSRTDRR
jgi:hypothetical protein